MAYLNLTELGWCHVSILKISYLGIKLSLGLTKSFNFYLNVLDVSLTVKKPLWTRGNRVEQRLLSHLHRCSNSWGRCPLIASTILSNPGRKHDLHKAV